MKKEIKRVIIAGILLNIILVIIKLLGGFLGKTTSLISDGYNSLTDVLISIMLLIILTISNKKPDKDHQYGHEKYEGISNFILGLVLLFTAGMVIYEGAVNIINYDSSIVYEEPKIYAIYIAFAAIIIKIVLFMINMKAYKKFHQASLKADSYNHLVDIFATAASLIGIVIARFGLIYFDYIASIIIGLIILKSAYEVIKESISFLVDESPSKEVMDEIKKTILGVNGVIKIDDFKARKHMNNIYVDVEIAVKKDMMLVDAHKIAEDVHHKVEKEYSEVIHCMVHVNPS